MALLTRTLVDPQPQIHHPIRLNRILTTNTCFLRTPQSFVAKFRYALSTASNVSYLLVDDSFVNDGGLVRVDVIAVGYSRTFDARRS